MTALTVPACPEEDASLRPVPWRRMARVTWRQHRIALAGVAVFLGALAVCLWKVGRTKTLRSTFRPSAAASRSKAKEPKLPPGLPSASRGSAGGRGPHTGETSTRPASPSSTTCASHASKRKQSYGLRHLRRI